MLNEEKEIKEIRNNYPKGTRIRLICMKDPYLPVIPGTEGTVRYVDSVGTIHMKWDDGRTLGLIASEDEFEIIKEERI